MQDVKRWVIPSAEWRDEILILRELYNISVIQAQALLNKYGTAEAAFEALPC